MICFFREGFLTMGANVIVIYLISGLKEMIKGGFMFREVIEVECE